MHILLIGATGQIGYALTQALADSGHQLTVMVRRPPQNAFAANVQVHQVAEFTHAAFCQALQGVDTVIYGVGLPEQFAFDDGIFDRVNLGLFRSFLGALETTPVRRLVYISTYEIFKVIDGTIRESHPVSPLEGMTPCFRAMINAYQLAQDTAARIPLQLTTIHPAAVYGGLNTGDGFTNYLENLVNWRIHKMPANLNGRFPLVHAASLAQAIVQALPHTGAFIVSDGMTSMPEMARALRQQTRSYVPITIPKALAYLSAALLELLSRITRQHPILAKVQVDFITNGSEPIAAKAQQTLGWKPQSLENGLVRYLRERTQFGR
jgi:nucleoside-diphosphate-sugar epimerase